MKPHAAKLIKQAQALERQGKVPEALEHYSNVLENFPKNANARTAIRRLRTAAAEPPTNALARLSHLYQQQQMTSLLQQSQAIAASYPRSARTWTFVGAAAAALGQVPLARDAFARTAALEPGNAAAHANLGAAFERLGDFENALACFDRAVALAPDDLAHLRSRGAAHLALGQPREAVADLSRFCDAIEHDPTALRDLGRALEQMGRFEDALASLKRAAQLAPEECDLRVDMAEIMLATGRPDDAQSELTYVLSVQPDHAGALSAQSRICLSEGDRLAALACLEKAVTCQPDNAVLWNNLSAVRLECEDTNGAGQAAEKAVQLDPSYAKGFFSLGNAHHALGQMKLATDCYGAAVRLDPALEIARTKLYHFQALICDWSDQDRDALVRTLGLNDELLPPWPALAMEDAPERQQLRSQRFAAQWADQRPAFARAPKDGPITVGYVSSDIYDHATLSLFGGVLAAHDPARVRPIVYALNAPRRSHQVDRLKSSGVLIRDMHDATDADIVDQARRDELDIAVDLKGYTKDARSGLFFAGLAPVQVNFLGYAGTLGSKVFDYIVADRTVIPPEQRDYYDESVLFMPHTYQPNDNARAVGAAPDRGACGLPEDAIVLSCFNNPYKISADVFEIWMRVLTEFENTVLWMLDANPWATENLRNEARTRGVDPERLIFAPKVSEADHIARSSHADLFLDTFNCNAHTTASDALYAGVPVITRPGSQFAARVGASLCRAVGMGELIAQDTAAYEALIGDLVRDDHRRLALRQRLAAALPTAPLFDTTAFARALETGFRIAMDRWYAGAKPTDIYVSE